MDRMAEPPERAAFTELVADAAVALDGLLQRGLLLGPGCCHEALLGEQLEHRSALDRT